MGEGILRKNFPTGGMDPLKTTDPQGTCVGTAPGGKKLTTENTPDGLINGLVTIKVTNLFAELAFQTLKPGLGQLINMGSQLKFTDPFSGGFNGLDLVLPGERTKLGKNL
jgi:hypothetical protein